MFGMSMTEILVILVIVLVVMGPEKIPDAARMAGKAMRELRKASNLLRDAVLIDDQPTRPRPKPVASVEPDEAPRLDQMGFDQMDFDPSDVVNPAAAVLAAQAATAPSRDVSVVAMSPRRRPSTEGAELEEFTLAPARAEIVHREVYLHIPYEETM